MHPLVYGIDALSDNELEEKVLDLNRKYWRTQNPDVQHQISMAIDSYKYELESRRARQRLEQQNQENGEGGLDNLIKVS
jgi:hypothetical protein